MVSAELDALSTGVVSPGLGLASDLTTIWSEDGLDLEVLSQASTQLDRSLAVITDSRRQIESIPSWGLIPPVSARVGQLEEYLAQAEPIIRDAGRAAGSRSDRPR